MSTTYILDAPGPLRFHLYFSFILYFVLGFPLIAGLWFATYYLFFWDEFKFDFLDYNEFLDDCLDMFRLSMDDIERGYRFTLMLKTHYAGKPVPEELIQRATAGTSHDYDENRFIDSWDTYDLEHIRWALDWIEDDWAYAAETELDDESDFKKDDLSFYYYFFHFNRQKDGAPSANKLPVYQTWLHVPPVISSQSQFQSTFVLQRHESVDHISFFDDEFEDDFRFNFWKERNVQQQSLSRPNPTMTGFSNSKLKKKN